MEGHVVAVHVSWVVVVSQRVVTEVLICLVMVIVVIAAPLGTALMVVRVLIVTCLVRCSLSSPVLVMAVVIGSGVVLSMVEHVFVVRDVRLVDRVVDLMSVFGERSMSLRDTDILMMNLTLGISVVEATMLVGPKEFFVAGD